MTRGREPGFADTPLARWVEEEMSRLEINKTMLEEIVLKTSEKEGFGPKLKENGAKGVVRRATTGDGRPTAKTVRLLEEALGALAPDDVRARPSPELEVRLRRIEDQLELPPWDEVRASELARAAQQGERLAATLRRLPANARRARRGR